VLRYGADNQVAAALDRNAPDDQEQQPTRFQGVRVMITAGQSALID
jgi:hypothetical protein